MTQLADLYRLQEIDRRRKELEDELKTLPAAREIRELSTGLAALDENMAMIKAELKRLERERSRQEDEAAGYQAKRRDLERRLYDGTVTNVKELEKLQKMIADCGRSEATAEDRGLAAMLRAEELSEELTRLQQRTAGDRERLSTRDSEYRSGVERLTAQLAELPPQREAALDCLDRKLVEQYETLCQKKNGYAVALVEKMVCSGCRVGVPMASFRDLKQGEKLLRCENCGRILYWRNE